MAFLSDFLLSASFSGPQEGTRYRGILSTSNPQPLLVFWKRGNFGLTLKAVSSSWRSSFCQLSLRIQGLPLSLPPAYLFGLRYLWLFFHLLYDGGFLVSCTSISSFLCCSWVNPKRNREVTIYTQSHIPHPHFTCNYYRKMTR